MPDTGVYLKIDGIPGEATAQKHDKEMEVQSFSWGISNSGTAVSGSGAGGTPAHASDLTITKYSDTASPLLARFCASGKHIPEAILSLNKQTGNDQVADLEYMKFVLKDFIITNFSTSGGSGSTAMESFSLNYCKVEMEYTQQTEKGGTGMNPKMSFDVKTGKLT